MNTRSRVADETQNAQPVEGGLKMKIFDPKPAALAPITSALLTPPGCIEGEEVNDALKHHLLKANDWGYQDSVTILHQWATRFNDEFGPGLQTPAIRLDSIAGCRLGTYRRGRDGFGLRHEITLNTKHLDRPLAELLTTLFHELIHEWQELYGRGGRNNYHNQTFRRKARFYGLMVDGRGHNLGVERGLFTELLSQHRVETLSLPIPGEKAYTRPRGNPKMRKWRCGCTTVRCALALAARCERCGLTFEEARPAW